MNGAPGHEGLLLVALLLVLAVSVGGVMFDVVLHIAHALGVQLQGSGS